MDFAIYLPLLLGLPLVASARWIAVRRALGPAARGLTVAALVAAAFSTWSLVLLALTLLDDLPPLAARDVPGAPEPPEPVPGPVALAAAGLLTWGAVRLARDAYRRWDIHRRLRAAGSPHGDLLVADWTVPLAVAVPGRPGRLLVTTGLFTLLDARERQVVFAHERSHLARRHHRLVGAVAAAAAVNPLLTGVREAVDYLVERWADEDAARAVGDRDLTARTVARVALATVEPWPAATLGMSSAAAVLRVRALGNPAPTARRGILAGPVLLGVAGLVPAAVATAGFVALAKAWL